jgi:single-stranded-DNA-specific exonuclease
MSMNNAVWILNPPGPEAERLSGEAGIPLSFAQILVNRKISDIEEATTFLEGGLDDLYDPFLLDGMDRAVERINKAVACGEKIIIFGDYDVDGILSVVALRTALEARGGDVGYYIPERLKNGYGIKEEYLPIVHERGAKLVISVDCGMRANAFVKRAKTEGVDVIITDHHRPGPEIPEALAVLNPVLATSGYPYPKLAGIGVVFKLIQGLFFRTDKASQLPHYLKLVSIATIADVAELRDENRIFVRYGLKGLENVSNPGLAQLLKKCRLSTRALTVGDVGFRIAPRINAAGRLGETETAVRLFSAESEVEAEEIVRKLDRFNSKRQKIEERIFKQAKNKILHGSLDKKYRILILGSEEWHRGIIGIVASKLKDLFYRPVILFSYQDGKAFGSGRSIPEFSLIECLEHSGHCFLNYGGHTHAVGCELNREGMGLMREALNAYVLEAIPDEMLHRKIRIDSRLDFDEIDMGFLEYLAKFAPYGIGNPKPVFFAENAEVAVEPRVLQGRHLKLYLSQGNRMMEALAWDRGEWHKSLAKGSRLDLVFTLNLSEYMGEERINLTLLDIRPR